jgi:hypothetical protein
MFRVPARARSLFGWFARAASLAAALVLFTPRAHAQEKIDKLIDQLASNDDFRVRTQAALALGASKAKRAVTPLCKALDDSNTTVRAASAAALGKLKLGGRDCLQKRLGDEPSESVKASIKKAITLVSSEGAEEPEITSSTKYYISIGKTADKTGRNGDDVDGIVRAAMSRTARGLDGYALAPNDETPPQAKKRLAKFKKLKAFLLLPRVVQPSYTGNSLTIKLEVAIFTYPDRSLKGTIPVKLTQEDVSSKDPDAENELIKMAAERAIEKFQKNADRIE